MPKKKLPEKVKPKHSSKTRENLSFKENEGDNSEEEYTTVADLETNKKYSKRLLTSNWSKYETKLQDYDISDEDSEFPKTDDFTYLLKTASSDCSHFQLNSEKLWRSEENALPSSKIFNLDLNMLSSGLACVPFYERIGLDGSELPAEDKQKFDEEAELSWKNYSLILKKSEKNLDDESKLKILNNNKKIPKTFEESFKVSLSLNESDEKNDNTSMDKKVTEIAKTDQSLNQVEVVENNDNNIGKIEKSKQAIFFNQNDENLEDWLDNILDD